MTVQEIVTAKLGIDLCPHVEITIAEAGEYIKNYCHLDEIPAALTYTWANMAIGLFEVDHKDKGAEAPAGPLSSVSMGDTSYSFTTDRRSIADSMSEIAGDFKAQLNRYRRGLFDNEYTENK